jgi:hypothetical protein
MAVSSGCPAFSVLMLKYNGTFWRYLTGIIRGEITYPDLPKKLGPCVTPSIAGATTRSRDTSAISSAAR